jgi:hypothetical protein
LRSYEYPSVALAEFGPRIDIQPGNLGLRAEVLSPELKRAAVINANFEKPKRFHAFQRRQKRLIYLEIMTPFEYEPPFMLIESSFNVASVWPRRTFP